jgi:hypothetical protein
MGLGPNAVVRKSRITQHPTLRQWIEREIARLAASDVGSRQDRAKVLARLLADYEAGR